jgi:hypothetical protein
LDGPTYTWLLGAEPVGQHLTGNQPDPVRSIYWRCQEKKAELLERLIDHLIKCKILATIFPWDYLVFWEGIWYLNAALGGSFPQVIFGLVGC